MSKFIFSFFFFAIINSFGLLAQNKFTLSGTVYESSTKKKLTGVTFYIPKSNIGVSSNEVGFYSLTLPEGKYTIQINYVGYQNITQKINLNKNLTQDFNLKESIQELDEIVITDDISKIDIRNPQMSTSKFTVETIKSIPVVFGEADVIKSILLLPGVTNAGEASTGFNVRGGAAGQNLILLDDATIFNSSHLFGFFSVFNPDAIEVVSLYKGGIPARHGGRVSSVLEISQKEGSNQKFKMKGGVGTVAGRLSAEGPIVKDRSSFLVGARASYGHLFLPYFDIGNSAYFYDFNVKLNQKINDDNKIFLSTYFGRDNFSLDENYTNKYGNSVINFHWNKLITKEKSSDLALMYSNYFFGLDLDLQGFNWRSNIGQFQVKYDLKNYINENLQANYGFSNIFYRFNPGTIQPNSADSDILEKQLSVKTANESSAFFDIEHYISEKFSMQYGIRFSLFARLGQNLFNKYKYDEPVIFDPFLLTYIEAEPLVLPPKPPGVRNSTTTGISSIYANPEPRISAAYSINKNTSIKASYNRMAQYIHLLSNTNSPTPLDVWTPSGPFIKPQLLDQYALGFFKNFSNNVYSFETEVFYKHIKNRIDYIDGANLVANDAIERVVLNGESRSYGIEVLFRKNTGKFKGWVSYTLSKSEQHTPGREPTRNNGRSNKETGINFGEWYNTPYDKPHDVAVYGSYSINKKWTVNMDFIYQTGQPTNYPIGQFKFEGLTIPYYGLRNVERLPDYHRIDLSATFIPSNNGSKKWYSEWIFSIYNVYNRKNAASINFRKNQETGQNEAVRTSIFGIVPSITYNFNF